MDEGAQKRLQASTRLKITYIKRLRAEAHIAEQMAIRLREEAANIENSIGTEAEEEQYALTS